MKAGTTNEVKKESMPVCHIEGAHGVYFANAARGKHLANMFLTCSPFLCGESRVSGALDGARLSAFCMDACYGSTRRALALFFSSSKGFINSIGSFLCITQKIST